MHKNFIYGLKTINKSNENRLHIQESWPTNYGRSTDTSKNSWEGGALESKTRMNTTTNNIDIVMIMVIAVLY